MAVNPIQIQKFLKGVDYPASKNDLLKNAEREGADEDARATLERLPDQEYDSPADVERGPGQDRLARPMKQQNKRLPDLPEAVAGLPARNWGTSSCGRARKRPSPPCLPTTTHSR